MAFSVCSLEMADSDGVAVGVSLHSESRLSSSIGNCGESGENCDEETSVNWVDAAEWGDGGSKTVCSTVT